VLNRVKMKESSLIGTCLSGSLLMGADLSHSNLIGADLQQTHLTLANLEGANLQHANLRFANLQGANLNGANLKGADFTCANLADCYVYPEQLLETISNKAILPDQWDNTYKRLASFGYPLRNITYCAPPTRSTPIGLHEEEIIQVLNTCSHLKGARRLQFQRMMFITLRYAKYCEWRRFAPSGLIPLSRNIQLAICRSSDLYTSFSELLRSTQWFVLNDEYSTKGGPSFRNRSKKPPSIKGSPGFRNRRKKEFRGRCRMFSVSEKFSLFGPGTIHLLEPAIPRILKSTEAISVYGRSFFDRILKKHYDEMQIEVSYPVSSKEPTKVPTKDLLLEILSVQTAKR